MTHQCHTVLRTKGPFKSVVTTNSHKLLIRINECRRIVGKRVNIHPQKREKTSLPRDVLLKFNMIVLINKYFKRYNILFDDYLR